MAGHGTSVLSTSTGTECERNNYETNNESSLHKIAKIDTRKSSLDTSAKEQVVFATGTDAYGSASLPSSPFFVMGDLLSSQSRLQHPGDREDEEVVSLGSTSAYFEPDDFDKSTWKNVLLKNPSAFGFAVVALATALTHPLLFIAGAVTALGTATAARNGYDCYVGDSKGAEEWSWRSCFDNAFFGGDRDTKTLEANVNITTTTPVTAAKKPNEKICDDATVECSSSSTEDENLPRLQTRLRSPEQKQEHFLQHYPPLNDTVVTNGGPFVGLNVLEFFLVFLDDDAPYSFKAFQEKRGDNDIEYGRWENLAGQHNGALSLLPLAPREFSSSDTSSYVSFQTRKLSFKAKTNNYFGPPYATTVKTQRFLVLNKRLAILESRTDLFDIPFSDRFFVMDRWVITAEKVNERYVAHVTVSCQVFFVASCPFEQQIKTKSTSAISDVATAWCTMAIEALKLTEQAKLDRLQRSKLTDNDDDDDDIDGDDSNCIAARDESGESSHLNGGVELIVSDNNASGVSIVGENDIVLLASPEQLISSPRRKILRRTWSQRFRFSTTNETNLSL